MMKATIPTLLLTVTLAASNGLMAPARAQDDFPVVDWGPIMQAEAMGSATRDAARGPKSHSSSPRGPRPKKPSSPRASTAYRPSSAVRKRVEARVITELARQGNSPQTVAQVKRAFAQNDVVQLWAKDVAASGLKRGDVADAMTAYWVQSWRIANGATNTTRAQTQGARRQVASILAFNAGFARLSNAARQDMAEGFIYAFELQDTFWQVAVKSGDKARQKQFRDQAAISFKQKIHFDLRNFKLTGAGFVAKTQQAT